MYIVESYKKKKERNKTEITHLIPTTKKLPLLTTWCMLSWYLCMCVYVFYQNETLCCFICLFYLRFSNFPCHYIFIVSIPDIYSNSTICSLNALYILFVQTTTQSTTTCCIWLWCSLSPWSSPGPLLSFNEYHLLRRPSQLSPLSEFVCLPPCHAIWLVLQHLKFKSES